MKSRIALSEENLVHLVALLTAAMGVVNVLSAVTPSMRERLRLLEQYSPFSISIGGHLTSALAGFALLLLSVSLWRKKQLGWILTFAILLISIPVHLFKGLDYEEATLAALLAGLLFYLRPYFHARSDPPSIRQGLQILLAAFVFTITYGVLGFFLLDRHFKISFGFWMAIRQTVVMFTEFYDPGLQSLPITRFGRYFADSIYIVGAVMLSYALIMLLRPVLNRRNASEDERARAWEIVRAHGRTSIARYTLFDDKHFYFASDNSLISYTLENRVALALGGPIGPLDEIPASISAFKLFCAPNDWLPAFFLVLPDHLEAYKAAGFDTLLLGQEAIVDLSKFTLEGSDNKTLRNSYNKMVRNGYRFDVVQPPFSPRMLRELDLISNEWLASRGVTEMRFS
ncbi:MAG: phosphatidylglycerol lysyltransferase domain-containing protein, partial [Chloroflexota bacterium]